MNDPSMGERTVASNGGENRTGQVERLQAEVGRLKALLQSTQMALLHQGGESFLRKVRREKERSERYKHFFALVAFECDPDELGQALSRVQASLRNADIVGVLPRAELLTPPEEGGPPASNPGHRVGMVMPETNRQGADVAARRALRAIDGAERPFAMALYPDDSTDAVELLRMVAV